MRHPTLLLYLLAFVSSSLTLHAHSMTDAIKEMRQAANAWLTSLSTEQRAQAVIALTDPERENFHYIPKTRRGLPFGEMNAKQRDLARGLLRSGLSHTGVEQAEAVIALENVLREVEKADYRDEARYHFTVFGSPDTEQWGWRVEGHHLSVNFTIAHDHVAVTPNFVGANPATVPPPGPQTGKRALAAEEDQGRALVLALSAEQRAQAIISNQAPGDILTRAERTVRPFESAGLPYSAMTPAQQTQFRALVSLYANRLRHEIADTELQKIADAGWNKLSFIWAGSVTPGEGHYYRIQGPDFAIEYDNTQNRANHIHTVWRQYDGDFGRDLLQEHYRESHSGASSR